MLGNFEFGYHRRSKESHMSTEEILVKRKPVVISVMLIRDKLSLIGHRPRFVVAWNFHARTHLLSGVRVLFLGEGTDRLGPDSTVYRSCVFPMHGTFVSLL